MRVHLSTILPPSPPLGLPGIPTNLVASATEPDKLQLSWDLLPDVLPEEKLNYTVNVLNLDNMAVTSLDVKKQSQLLFAQLPDTPTCVMHQFTVFAVNVLGSGEESDSVTSTIPIGMYALIAKPCTVSAISPTHRFAYVLFCLCIDSPT